MSLGLRLSLLLLIAGCAEQLVVVPDSDWRTVPSTQRTALDRQCDADLAAARAERTAASASLAALQRAQPAPLHATPPPAPAPADPNDPSAIADREHEQARISAFARVEAATAEVRRTDLTWRRLRVDAADARIAMLTSQREVLRAQAIDHNLPGTDHYDVAPLRGQFSRAQQRWYAASSRAGAARDAFEHASTSLASAKEAYAQLMRGGPTRPPGPAVAADDHAAHLELPGWAVTRGDIVRRRRGLRHFLEETSAAPPRLRRAAFQISPALRVAPPARPSPALPAAPPSPPASTAARPSPAPTAAPPSPADRAAHPPPPAVAASAGTPAAGAPRGTAPPPPPAVADHPADRAGHPSPPAAASARKPAVGPSRGPAPAPGQPAERAAHPSAPGAARSGNAKQATEAP